MEENDNVRYINKDPELVRCMSRIEKEHEEILLMVYDLYKKTGDKAIDEKMRLNTDKPDEPGLVQKWMEIANGPRADNKHNQIGITIIKNKFPNIERLNKEMKEDYDFIIERYEIIIANLLRDLIDKDKEIMKIPDIKEGYLKEISSLEEKYKTEIIELNLRLEVALERKIKKEKKVVDIQKESAPEIIREDKEIELIDTESGNVEMLVSEDSEQS